MYELKKNRKVFTSKFVGTGPSYYEKRIYRAAVSQRSRNSVVEQTFKASDLVYRWHSVLVLWRCLVPLSNGTQTVVARVLVFSPVNPEKCRELP